MHHWCWGEDAVFDCPCGPDEAYHGHKPTCWRDWQAPASVWRDERCGCPTSGYGPAPLSPVYHDGSGPTVTTPPPIADPRMGEPEDGADELRYETLPVGPEGLEDSGDETEMLPDEALDSARIHGFALPVASWLQSPQRSKPEGRQMPLVAEGAPWSTQLDPQSSDASRSTQSGGCGSFGFRIVK
ncbi:hypothetical protein K2D_33660 [Planctomycetes bacterium K2D]|nr:hypothetical protein K2D_33660 [Planctomycetes bacterium K2D]